MKNKSVQFIGTIKFPDTGNDAEVWYYDGSIFTAEFGGQYWSRVTEIRPLRDIEARIKLTLASEERYAKTLSDKESADKHYWMDEARQVAAQCWCDPETKNTEMDPVLAEAVANRIAAWMETAARNQKNGDYYRGLVVEIGNTIGKEAYVQDDGGICTDVLCAKVPELVKKLVDE